MLAGSEHGGSGAAVLGVLHDTLLMADRQAAPMLRFLFLETLRPVTHTLWRWLYTADGEVRRGTRGSCRGSSGDQTPSERNVDTLHCPLCIPKVLCVSSTLGWTLRQEWSKGTVCGNRLS